MRPFSVLGPVVQNVVVTAVWQPVGDSCGKLLKVRTNPSFGAKPMLLVSSGIRL